MNRFSIIYWLICFCALGCQKDSRVLSLSQNPNDSNMNIHMSHEKWSTWINTGLEVDVRIEALKQVLWESGVLFNEDIISANLIEKLAYIDADQNLFKNLDEIKIMAFLNGSEAAIQVVGKFDLEDRLRGDFENVKIQEGKSKDIFISRSYLVKSSMFLHKPTLNLDSAALYLDFIAEDKSAFKENELLEGIYYYLNGFRYFLSGDAEKSIDNYNEAYAIFELLNMPSFMAEAYRYNSKSTLNFDIEKAKLLAERARELCDKNNFWYQKLGLQIQISEILGRNGQSEAAMSLLDEVIDFDSRKESNLEFVGLAYMEQIIYFIRQSDLSNALINMQKGKDILNKIENRRDLGAADLLYTGLLYENLNNLDSARYYLNIGLDQVSSINFVNREVTFIENIAQIEHKFGNTERAVKMLENSLLNMQGKIWDKINVKIELGNLLCKLKRYDEAKSHYQSALELHVDGYDEYDEDQIAYIHAGYSNLFIETNQLDSALTHSIQLLEMSKKLEILPLVKMAHDNLSILYEKKGDYKTSLQHTEDFRSVSQLIITKENAKDLGRIEAEPEHRMELSNRQKIADVLMSSSNREKRLYILYSIIASLLLLLLALFAWQRSQRVKLLESVADLEKENALSLKKISDQRTQIMADIAHDFRIPLNMIQSFLSDMIKGLFVSDLKESWIHMKSNADVLLQLINQMLELSKLDEGFLLPNYATVNIVELIDEVLISYKSMASVNNITLIGNIVDKPFYLTTEEVFIKKIIDHLVSNAIKYSNEGGKVELKLSITKSNFSISVKDSGVGLNDAEIDQILTRYRRIDENRSNEVFYLGGLGLSIVSELTTLLKGDITVESVPNEGTLFTVVIPHETEILVPSAEEWIEKEYLMAANLGGEDSLEELNRKVEIDEKKRTLLLVEDNRRLNEFLTQKLLHHYNVIQGFNGLEGEELALEHLPDVILTDMVMPRKSGIDLAESLSTNITTSHIPIIFFSMNYQDIHKVKAFKSGGMDFLEKPISIDILVLKINNLLALVSQSQSRVINTIYSDANVLELKEVELSPIDQEFIRNVVNVIQENFHDSSFNVNELCKLVLMSRTQCYKKIKSLTGQSPKSLILKYRMSKAMKLLTKRAGKIDYISRQVGFNNSSHFSRTFSDYYGVKPGHVPYS